MTARANSITTVILGRTLAGLAASPGTTLAGGSIADMFDTNKRGLPMSVLTMITFMGTSFGPGLMGFVGQYCGWRWIIYIDVIVSGLLSLALIFLTQETRGSVLLSRRAKKLREEKNDPRIQCRSDAERASLLILIKISMTRPVYLLCTEAVVFFISVYISMAWGTMFLALEATSLVFENVYGFTLGQSGAVFFTMFIGGFLGFLANFYQERLYQRTVATRGPEARLYASCVGGLLFPIGLIIFAFAPGRTHWMGPVMGLFFTYFGIFCIYLASMNCTQEPFTKREAAQYAHPYFAPTDLADAYTIYASSAISGQSLMRNCVAGAFPLFTYQLYGRLAMLATVLSATPFVLLKYGPKIRAASLFSKELERMRAANPNQ
ncbi:hypothetical protein MNV49_001133 [Pseudohyphozyma bogoriensis]|nr:hypothetical protein MNV49_001133 [Pseudohyphozyma bogoriensis]